MEYSHHSIFIKVLEYNGDINGTSLDSNYIPDKIDEISSTPNAVILVVS